MDLDIKGLPPHQQKKAIVNHVQAFKHQARHHTNTVEPGRAIIRHTAVGRQSH